SAVRIDLGKAKEQRLKRFGAPRGARLGGRPIDHRLERGRLDDLHRGDARQRSRRALDTMSAAGSREKNDRRRGNAEDRPQRERQDDLTHTDIGRFQVVGAYSSEDETVAPPGSVGSDAAAVFPEDFFARPLSAPARSRAPSPTIPAPS